MTVKQISMRALGVIDTGLVTLSIIDDREFINFPVKALREQILECMNCLPGGEFVPGSEIRKALKQWNGKPITIDHPTNEQGQLEFANRDEKFLESVKVGFIDNARWEGGFLWVDAHLDRLMAAESVEGRGVLGALLSGAVDLEVSTGYGMDLEFREGKFEGQRYHFAQSEIEPDHLALLPIGDTGACSVEDGCGAARNTQKKLLAAAASEKGGAMKPGDILAAIMGLLKLNSDDPPAGGDPPKDPPDPAADPAANAGGDGGDPNAIKPPEGDPNNPGGDGDPDPLEAETMDRTKLILALVALAAKLPFEQKELEAMTDERLTSLATLAGIDCGCGDDPAANADGDDPAGEGDPDPAADPSGGAGVTLSAEEYAEFKQLLSVKDELSAQAATLKATADAEHAELVTALHANEACAIPEEQLKGIELQTLRNLAKSFLPVDYSGLGMPRSLGLGDADDGDDGGFMPLPTLVKEDESAAAADAAASA